jgi:hypothetical protein
VTVIHPLYDAGFADDPDTGNTLGMDRMMKENAGDRQ